MKWSKIKDKEIAYQLGLAKVGNQTGNQVEICQIEARYCNEIGIKTGIKYDKKNAPDILFEFFKTLRNAGRVGFFDKLDEDVFFAFSPGNDRESQEIEYAFVICQNDKKAMADAIQKAIAIGKRMRKDAIVAICSPKKCEFIKLREMRFDQISK